MNSSLSKIPAFRRSTDGTWREITEAEWAQSMLEAAHAPCRVVLDEYPGDESVASCKWTMGVHPRLVGQPSVRLHENADGTRRWYIDERGDTHAWARPGTAVA